MHHFAFYLYSYRLADHPQLSTEFTKYLKRLSQGFKTNQDRSPYRRMIDTYGTHYIHQVTRLRTSNTWGKAASKTYFTLTPNRSSWAGR